MDENSQMAIKLQHIDHIALTVRDVAASTRWYCDVLGFEHRFPGLWDGVPAMLFIGDTGLALFPVSSDDPASPPGSDTIAVMHVAFRVNREAFQTAQDDLRSRGIAFNFQDHDISHSIYFYDPDGHQLEITTYEI